jgi:N,N'-diacetyllegionaminate synthase
VSVLVIAEPGCLHEGSREKLFELLSVAARAGASCFKPQWTSDPDAMLARRRIGWGHERYAYYKQAYSWLAFPESWHNDLSDRCHALGMQYACSVYLPGDVQRIAPVVDWLKVSSFENQDDAMKRACAGLGSRLIVSHGCSGADMRWGWPSGAKHLHCVSAYPTPKAQANIRRVDSCDGYSDHTRHLLAGALAVARGAEIIETHFRADTSHPSNPDFHVAFSPAEFAQYIQNIRDAEAMMGDGLSRGQPCEDWAIDYKVRA